MTLLHVYFTLRNQQAFQRLLERDRSSAAPGSQQAGQSQSQSTGKSWTRKHVASALEVNALDALGRTVLHRACASTDPASVEYVRMLLAHPAINVNLHDKENHWTALHRALYAGNIEAAIMLLKRTDTDMSIKDMEGYTAFDLYNSTVQSAHPTSLADGYAELLTWGANRNAALGLGDGNDRIHPDHVVILKKDVPLPTERTLEERFQQVRVRGVTMSKLHTVILTDELRDNVRLCGFGSGGRLGPFSHTLYTPTSLTLSSHTIVSVALGQDHTLALTNAGEVISWGLNRFAQLGYTVESGQGSSAGESIQTTPRKISHLKKEFMKGVAACKTASACWSDGDLWTWGTNSGQLGYSKSASPVQVLPRKASIITRPIRGIALSETAMVCLFMTGEVVCVWNSGVSKINFPAHAFPSDISTIYRPPQAVRAPPITKLSFCDDLFAALSSNGEVFTFSLPAVIDAEGGVPGAHTSGNRGQVKPQRAWALRRQFSSVRDVDVGGDGTLIVCTQSGHVFVRSRNLKGGTTSSGAKAFKFQRIAHMQRAVAVCANSTGAFGALRVDYKPPAVELAGRHFSADMAAIAPYIVDEVALPARHSMNPQPDAIIGTDDDLEDASILGDITEVTKLMSVLCNRVTQVERSVKGISKHGADISAQIGTEFEIPTHRIVLAGRCVPLRGVFSGHATLRDESSKVSVTFTPGQQGESPVPPTLHFTGITPLSLLILFHYLYADEVLAVWDRRIGSLFESQFTSLGLSAVRVKEDLATLAHLLSLGHLTFALQSVGKRAAKPSAGSDFRWLFDQAQPELSDFVRRHVDQDPLAPDVALHLADKTIYVHSVILRARSEFFAALFHDPDWTVERKDSAGVVDIDMKHHKWHVMRFVLPFICFGEETMFETLDFLGNVDELLEFMFHVISIANELLLTRLVLICSRIVLKYLNVYNACYLLTDAIHFNAVDLADCIQSYMTANLELLLESRFIDDLDLRVVRRLSEHARAEQAAQSPVSRSNKLGQAALEKHKEWLALQDIPGPIIPSQKVWSSKDSPRMSPPGSAKKAVGQLSKPYSANASPVLRPSIAPQPPPPEGDEIFVMDDADGGLAIKSSATQAGRGGEAPGSTPTGKPGWKTRPATPRTDLKAIMSEAENGRRQVHAKTLQGRGSGVSPSAATAMASATQGLGPPRQVGHVAGQYLRSDDAPTPRQMLPDSVTPQKSEPLLASAPSLGRTIVGTRPSLATGASPGPPQSTMGPVIVPVRQTPSSSGTTNVGNSARKPSLGGAWTLPPVQPIAAATVPGSAAPGTTSFAEIQRMQAIQDTMTTPVRNKRSLRDIQEEERARQQEADFLRWWAAEEERVRLEVLTQEEEQRAREQVTQNKGAGGKARARKSKGEVQPPQGGKGPLSGVSQQREIHGKRKARQRGERMRGATDGMKT